MDIPLRHDFTLSGAWEMLFPSSSSIREVEGHQKEDAEAGFEMGVGDGTANVNVHAEGIEECHGLDGSDSDDTSINSAVAEHPRPSSIREGEFHQGLEVGALFELGVEDDGAAKAQAGEPEEVDGLVESDSDDTSSFMEGAGSHDYSQSRRLDELLDQHRGPKILQEFARDHMAQTERLLKTIVILNTDAERKQVWIELRGSVAANVIDPVERARKAMAEFEESTDSREVKEERLKRALRIQVDTVQEQKEESQGIVIQNLGFARKEEVVEEGQGELYDGQDTMREVIRSQNTRSRVPREKNVEVEKSVRPIEGMSVEFHEMGLDIRGQENIFHGKTFGPPGHCSIEGVSTDVQRMSIEKQETKPSENSKATLFEEERSDMEAKNPQEQICEMDAGQLKDEAENDDGSLHDLPNPVTEIAGQDVPAAKARAPICALQESGWSKQQQCERLDAMWRVSSAYVEPIAGIPNDPHLQTHDQDCSRHELPSDNSNLGDAAPGHEGPSIGTTLQASDSAQAMITQIAMADPTSFDDGTNSSPHPLDSSAGKASPRAATEVATAALLEQLSTEQDDQADSNFGARDDIAKFDRGTSRFTLRTHILFSIIYAIWVAILYERVLATLC